MFDRRITIFTGHFGSGKTEVAVNYAVKMAKSGRKTAIVDMDIVNPFFRTADAIKPLEEMGIKVIVPVYANTNVDVPALPSEIYSLFDDKSCSTVFDVGGDDLGARVLSRFNDLILADDYVHYFVINTMRPMTRNKDEIIRMIMEIQASSRLKVDRLVNNANLLGDTTPEVISKASEIIYSVSQELSIPMGFISGMKEVLERYEAQPEVERLYMDKYIRLLWE